MGQRYMDTAVRRTPVKFYSRSFSGAATSGRAKAIYTELENVSLTNFKTRGGSESIVDGVLQVVSSAKVALQYRTDIKRGDRLKCLADNSFWEILNIENVDMQNQELILTVRDCEGVS